jgi:glycine hydroxymethyltransferase
LPDIHTDTALDWTRLVASPARAARALDELVQEHERWRGDVVNMIASENAMSDASRALLASDLAARVSLGVPGAKIFPPEGANPFVDEIELALAAALGRLVHAAYVEHRPQGVAMANAIVLSAVTERGDTIVAPSKAGGGNESYNRGSTPDLLGLEVVELPMTAMFDVDGERAAELILGVKPRLVFVGGMKVLKPYSLDAIRGPADEVGALIAYDAAHLVPLIWSGAFQDPLRDGADVLTFGTHKMLGGPVAGAIATNDAALAERFAASVYPLYLQTRDLNKYASEAQAAFEMLEHGAAYARACVAHAQRFAGRLADHGLRPLRDEDGFTQTHQVMVDVAEHGGGEACARRCIDAGVLVSKSTLIGDDTAREASALRFSVQEPTRRGMGPPELDELAEIVAAAVRSGPSPELRERVRWLAGRHTGIQFAALKED